MECSSVDEDVVDEDAGEDPEESLWNANWRRTIMPA